MLQSTGVCPICCTETTFTSHHAWLRDHFVCDTCGSVPRERALFAVLLDLRPDWQQAVIHESSPSIRGASARLMRDCAEYTYSYYFPGVPAGSLEKGARCENLEALTFADETFDIFVTQDVLEHVFHPLDVFREVARTLKPGGIHVFTVPITRYREPSRRRARLGAGGVEHLLPAEYHGDPVNDGGALVTVDWGWDISQQIFDSSGLFTHVFHIDDLTRGIRAAHIEVFATMKPLTPGGTVDLG